VTGIDVKQAFVLLTFKKLKTIAGPLTGFSSLPGVSGLSFTSAVASWKLPNVLPPEFATADLRWIPAR